MSYTFDIYCNYEVYFTKSVDNESLENKKDFYVLQVISSRSFEETDNSTQTLIYSYPYTFMKSDVEDL